MKTTKRFLSIACLGLLAVMPSAFAVDVISLTVPTVAADTTTNGLAQTLVVQNQTQTAVAITSSSTNLQLRFSASVDNTLWQTNYYVVGVLGAVTTITNLNHGGVLYLRLDSVANTGSIIATNTVKYGLKRESN